MNLELKSKCIHQIFTFHYFILKIINLHSLKTQAYETQKISKQYKISSQRSVKHKSLNRASGNRSLNRYKQGWQIPSKQEGNEGNSMWIDNKYAKKNNLILNESRNQHFKKAKSISQENENNLKLDMKDRSQQDSKEINF